MSSQNEFVKLPIKKFDPKAKVKVQLEMPAAIAAVFEGLSSQLGQAKEVTMVKALEGWIG